MSDLVVKEITDSRTFRVGSFTIQVIPQNCQVRITSWDWQEMNGENAWWHHGCETIWHFIAKMSMDPHYAMKKLYGSRNLLEIDEVATRKALMDCLKDYDLPKEEHNEVVRYLKDAYDVDSFAATPHIECPYEYLIYQEKFCCKEFRKMWPVFCGYVKEVVIPGLPVVPK